MLEGDIRKVAGGLNDHAAPEDAVLKNIRLVHRGDDFAPFASGLEGHAGDAADFRFPINHRIHREILAALALDVFRFAEIQTTGQLAHAKDIEPAGHDVRMQRRGVGQLGQANRGTQIREEAEVFSQRQEGRALGLLGRGQGFPFRAADRAKQDRIRILTGFQSFRGQGFSDRIDRGASDEFVVEVELKGKFLGGGFEDPDPLAHHFRSDAVAGQNRDTECLFRIHPIHITARRGRWQAARQTRDSANRPWALSRRQSSV